MNWYENIKKWYAAGYWTRAMVQDAVVKGKISRQQAESIIGNTPRAAAGK